MPDGSRFCTLCGAALEETAAPAQPTEEVPASVPAQPTYEAPTQSAYAEQQPTAYSSYAGYPQPMPKKKNKALITTIIIVAVIGLLVGAFFILKPYIFSSSPVGTYVVKSLDGEDVQETIEMYKEYGYDVNSAEDFMAVELKDGGKCVWKELGRSYEGEWKQDGDKITLTMEGQSIQGTLKGKELSLSNSSGSTAVFVKK